MTWQRIDENTYIDDTLITCAEYQLFIDEMREQGKYYQPDHWTSFQFPEGHAHEPILGVRHRDAFLFCEWLKEREGKEWNYRLPTIDDIQSPTILSWKHLSGYWLRWENQFTWFGPTPTDARNLKRNRIVERDFNLGLDLGNAYFPNFDRTIEINKAIARSATRPMDVAHIIYNEYFQIRLANGTKLPLISALNRTPDNLQNLFYGLKNERSRILANALDYFHSIERALDLYMDVFTLHERIEGRSPVFEGIRLVKERIR